MVSEDIFWFPPSNGLDAPGAQWAEGRDAANDLQCIGHPTAESDMALVMTMNTRNLTGKVEMRRQELNVTLGCHGSSRSCPQ